MKSTKQQILEYLQTIPRGKAATYRSIAKIFDTHPRAVATIMRTNSQPEKYPCYKVVSISGEILGYNNGGVQEKERLLKADGVNITKGKVDRSCLII